MIGVIIMNRERCLPTWQQLLIDNHDEIKVIQLLVETDLPNLIAQLLPDVLVDCNYVYCKSNKMSHKAFVEKLQPELTELYLLASAKLIMSEFNKKKLANITEDVLKLQNTINSLQQKMYMKGLTRIICNTLPQKTYESTTSKSKNNTRHS